MFLQVTPIDNLAINSKAIDWNFYHQLWTKLPEKLARVAKLVGIKEIYFMQKLGGKNLIKNEMELSKVYFIKSNIKILNWGLFLLAFFSTFLDKISNSLVIVKINLILYFRTIIVLALAYLNKRNTTLNFIRL